MTSPREVRRTFERIARPFSRTREHPWPEVRSFLEGRSATTALDLGCGNGRHATLLAHRADRVVGVDAARALLDIARRRAGEEGWRPALTLLQADAAGLPLAEGAVDLALYVATVHHLTTRERRLASLDELARVLAAGAPALVSAWSTAHERFDRVAGFDTTIDWTLEDGRTVGRFHHIYAPDEFAGDLAESELRVESTAVSSGNCYAVVRG